MLDRYLQCHKLKSDFYKAEWNAIKTNLEKLTKEACRQNHSLMHVLIAIKRLFNKTPITLKKAAHKQEDVYFREFTLFILVNYANASFEQISKEFSIDIHQLECYKNKEIYEKCYEKELACYFKEKMDSFAHSSYCRIAFLDMLEEDHSNCAPLGLSTPPPF